jgi:cytochrome P450
MVQQWDKVIATGETIEVTDWLTRLTLDVLGRTVFDVPFNTLESKEARVVELYRYLMEGFFNVKYMMAPFLDKRWNPYRRPYFEACDEINAFFLDIIAKKKAQVKERLEKEARGEVVEQSKKDKDLLTLMYESFYDSEETEMFSDEEMRANLAVFFLAGHDTTSIALVSQIYYLALHPDVQQKAREEVLELLPTDESITPKTKLAYLEAVINECLRLHPPTSMMPFRLTEHESELEGADGHEMTIPENTVMTLDIKSVHRNPQVWQDPDEFRVERWLNTDDKTDKRLGYCPFGGGPRICIGMNFSLLEQRVVLSMLLRRYTWTLPKDTIHTDGIIRNHGILILKLEKMNVQFTPVK